MKRARRFGPSKPLASLGASLTGVPVCYVDASVACAGHQIREAQKAAAPENKVKVVVQLPAARPEMKSWYFPMDAFEPWPQRTELCCWWCTCQFDTCPFPLPYSFDKTAQRFRCVGMFCGPSCAKAWARNSGRYNNTYNVFCYVDIVAHDFYGYKDVSAIKPAPPRELLQKFCGSKGYTVEQFRSLCAQGKTLKVHPPHFTTMKQVVESQQYVAKQTRNIYHKENPDDIKTVSDLVAVRRIPFAGVGVRRLTDYQKMRS